MTKGNPIRLILFFAIPLMLGNIFQQIYTITDSLIISRTLGLDALAALGSADWFDYMIITIIQATAQGFAILLSQDYGAGKMEHLHKVLAHSLYLSIVIAIGMSFVAVWMINPMLVLLQTPTSIAWMTKEYLTFKFIGLSASMLLNMSSSVLRAFGNSKTPLYAMVSSAVVNIGLDLLFVKVFGWGIAGAAIATVISQAIGGLVCVYVLKQLPFITLAKAHFGAEKGLNKHLILLSIPMMLQNILIAFGGIIVQSKVNTFDMALIAGYTATNKLYGALELAAIAYGFAIVTYVGQNYGAKKYDRLRKGFRDAILIALLTSAVIGSVMFLFGKQLTGIFLTGEASQVMQSNAYAYEFLQILSICLPILYILHIIRSFLQGAGNTFMPMISGIAEFIARVFLVLVVVPFIGYRGVYWAEIAAWIASDIVLIGSLIHMFHSFPKTKEAVSKNS